LQQLDSHIEQLNAKFTDQLIAAQYDADAVAAKYATATTDTAASLSSDSTTDSSSTKTSPCLGPRAHWMFCAQKYVQDTRPCDHYLQVLEKCVQETIVQRSVGMTDIRRHENEQGDEQ
jgi:hypothetical protein